MSFSVGPSFDALELSCDPGCLHLVSNIFNLVLLLLSSVGYRLGGVEGARSLPFWLPCVPSFQIVRGRLS
jgi:hypothetical protein